MRRSLYAVVFRSVSLVGGEGDGDDEGMMPLRKSMMKSVVFSRGGFGVVNTALS